MLFYNLFFSVYDICSVLQAFKATGIGEQLLSVERIDIVQACIRRLGKTEA